MEVTCTISTKGRHDKTLPITLMSIAMQTRVPENLVIYDDSEEMPDYNGIYLYQHIFPILYSKGVKSIWIYPGYRLGQLANHQRALDDCKTELIWRIDDDEYAEPNVLEELLSHMEPGVGAVGCCVWYMNFGGPAEAPVYAKGTLRCPAFSASPEFYKHPPGTTLEVDHLHSTFLYRVKAARKAGGYSKSLSPSGMREETMFTHSIYKAEYGVVFTSKAIVYHIQSPVGGMRDGIRNEWAAYNDKQFADFLKESNINIYRGAPYNKKLFVCPKGIGDNIMMKIIVAEYMKQYPEVEIWIASSFPHVWYDINVKQIPLHVIFNLFREDLFNIYNWCVQHNWQKSMLDAYREMYEINNN